MEHLCRKLLIRIGKVIPFVLAFIVLVGYVENVYSVLTDRICIDEYGMAFYYCPFSTWISNLVYIDWFDVLLVWILCFALELCKYSFRCAYLITLNLPFRWLVEHVSMPDDTIIGLASFMALAGLYCVCGGFKMIPQQRNKF